MEAVSTATGPLADVWTRIDAGQFDDAASLLRNLLKQQPSDGHLHALLGVCSAQQGRLEEAVGSLKTAVLLNPGDPVLETKLAGALLQSGKLDQARWHAAKALEADPNHEEARALMGHIQAAAVTAAQAPPPPSAQFPQAPSGAPTVRPHFQQPLPQYGAAAGPGMGLRLLRGCGWGLLYSQTWTVITMVSAVLISLLATRVEMALLVFVVLAVINTLFHSAMGLLIGVTAALMNADEDTGGWIGLSVGLLILLIGLFFGLLALWSVFFYIFVGRWIGRSVAAHIQKPVAG